MMLSFFFYSGCYDVYRRKRCKGEGQYCRRRPRGGPRSREITLVAATKVQTAETVREAIAAGVAVWGEPGQEMAEKLPVRLRRRAAPFIGHLQTNKVRQVVGRGGYD